MGDSDNAIESLKYEMAIEHYCYGESERYKNLHEELAKYYEDK